MPEYTQIQLDTLWLHRGTEQSPRVFSQLAASFDGVTQAREAAACRDAAAFSFVPERMRARLFDTAPRGELERSVEAFTRAGIRALFLSQEEYPALLREIYDPPAVLFVRGKLPADLPLPIAVIGSRAASHYGREMARLFGFGLAERGATVVSGLALGADGCAARGALESKKSDAPTVAVLGCGVDIVYPASNRDLYLEIVERGAAVSEYWPGTAARREHFPARNRIISGLSRGVLVVEAGERSGTSITVNCALEQGRDVFAIPGRVTDAQSVGSNRLIQQGAAKPCFCVEDILCEYACATERLERAAKRSVKLSALTPVEREVVRTLLEGEASIDSLCARLPYPVGALNSCLTGLTFSGIMKQLPGRVYALNISECSFMDE